ncbi:helix-turn-helix transcriptional regulator [Halorhabdus salina]|uniref:helix-turn-helix transcriptional regulator n=1 Tax=Halorhabdus salina TaxID=2750670 RepID=UPI0015EE8A7D|nr:MarR family transcriptional regulator [Halorhabdus salina]
MNRRRADAAAGLIIGAILLGGAGLVRQAFGQRSSADGQMGGMMDSMHGPDPLWVGVSTLLLVAVLVGVYLLVRPELTTDTESTPWASRGDDRDQGDNEAVNTTPSTDGNTESRETAGSTNPEANPTERVLDLLPDDERRVLEPVIESPGITQIELRDRSAFSKSKVSQTVSDLEERGLLYRERQGRTYRIYPSEDLDLDE